MDAAAELRRLLAKDVREADNRPVVTLDNPDEAKALVRFCRDRNLAIHPWNGRGRPTGFIPPNAVLALGGEGWGLDAEIAASDFYVDTPSALTIGRLREELDETRLWFPFAAPGAGQMTCAEVVARYPGNAFAPSYGQLPRLLLGVTYINDEGDVVASGRRTIKGVAGYDLAKLHLGARGRAGLIIRTRFRLFPRPLDAAVWRGAARPGRPLPAGVCAAATEDNQWFYAAGHPADVDDLRSEIWRLVGPGEEVARGPAALDLFIRISDAPPPPPTPPPAGPFFSSLFV